MLSTDGQRVLAAIVEHGGLEVTWRYRYPTPEYADGEPMPPEDWVIVERELYRIERHLIDGINIAGWHSDYLHTQQTYSDYDCVVDLWTAKE